MSRNGAKFVVDGLATTYGGLSLVQAAQAGAAATGAVKTYAVLPAANAPATDDQSQSDAQAQSHADETAAPMAAGAVNLTPASMSALIAAQASLTQNAPALIRRHTAEELGRMIWSLDSAPPLSPAPMAVRRLQAAQSALNSSLVDLQA